MISTAGYNERHPDIVLMPVTSQLRADARPDLDREALIKILRAILVGA